ncbi:MAG: RluA family pseudouridine synthase [Ruminococcus sp.]|nr:RluA family pseudouridine synthase [Ruminococcus sp.]
MKNFIINENDSDQRVDKFIMKVFPELPKSMMYKLIRKKDIKVNGKRCEISTRLQTGDTVSVYIHEKFSGNKTDFSFKEASPEINIVYEDENILIVNKPAGLTVHCDNEHEQDTLINRVKHYLYIKGCYDPESENSFAPALCSRLDKNTCGLVTAAKNAAALREINSAVRDGKTDKIYHCITAGVPPKKQDIMTAYHHKESDGNIVRVSPVPLDGYKEIKTGYRILRTGKSLALVEVTLYTGRTHQIRAHLSSIGCPVLGDGKYGNPAENKKHNRYYQLLCAYSLKFRFDPGSPLEYLNGKTFEAPVPDFEKLV